jgi:hypothetical protein
MSQKRHTVDQIIAKLRRAAYWYAFAIGDKTGLARKKLEKRIEEARFVQSESRHDRIGAYG